ncbi:MAG: class I SAM-dependent methyltransferase [Bacteroidetes bacterium]|nr:class I SAM-dependent methyltransferase [Bacteroidota bacterium]
MKIRLFEFEDLPWFPTKIREGMTDYLRFILNSANLYEPITPLLYEALEKSDSSLVLDLCSGSGGAIENIQKNIKRYYKRDIHFILSDKYPNLPSYKFLHHKTSGKIFYVDHSVDATAVPGHIKGFRTIFSGFHHFNRQKAITVIKDAVNARQGIAIFDGGDKNIFIIVAILIAHPLLFFACTPFFRPLTFSKILFTYLIPVIPICTIWDGIVSVLRLYKPSELINMGKQAGPHYNWTAGKVRNRFGMKIAYLVGYPPPL